MSSLTHTPDGTVRDELVRDMRLLADWLEANDAPIPSITDVEILIHISSPDEIRRIADTIGAPIESSGGRAWTQRRFGRARYRALHIPPEHMARFEAERSYAGAVEPDMAGVQ